MKIAVVVLNFNGIQDTLQCIYRVMQQKLAGFSIEIIIVDNASIDGSVEKIKQKFPHIHLLLNSENLGFAEGNNIGIKYALKKDVDFILILNNDTVLEESMILRCVEAAASEPKGGIFGPKIYFTKGKETHKSKYQKSDLGNVIWYAGGKIDWDHVSASHRGVDEVDKGQYNEKIKTTFVSGCAMFVRRSVFEKVGLFDKKYFMYFEDVDLCIRARKKGFEALYIPSAVLWHKNAGSSGGTGSELQVYYQTRNRLLLGMRYAPVKTKLALYREALVMLMKGTAVQKQAVGDHLRNFYGSRDRRRIWKMPDINLMKFWKKFPN